jgi:hypothetical protein
MQSERKVQMRHRRVASAGFRAPGLGLWVLGFGVWGLVLKFGVGDVEVWGLGFGGLG